MSEHGHIKFWQEIGRRNVLRVAAVYIGFSWAVVHSGVVVGEALELPHWIMRFVSAVLIVGFPAVVAFAWVYEMTPEGLKRSDAVEKSASITHRTAHRLNVVIIVLVAILIGLYGADRFLPRHEGAEGSAHVAAEAGPKAVASEGVSIAVLPFVNLSGDPGQEFFSDGMTEEITSALSKVKGLQVVGRTSAFEFKGQNKDLHAIGLALRASYLLEGSVRKSGTRVRITGQLIRADIGTHIWTENYDRELKDIFATQDDIARAIAAALQAPLGLKAGETLVAKQSIEPESYQKYLQARALYRARGTVGTNFELAARLLEELVATEPAFAQAWTLLAAVYQNSPAFGSDAASNRSNASIDNANAKAREAAQRAIDLDPRNAEAYAALATAQPQSQLLKRESLLREALEHDPTSPEVLFSYGNTLAMVGRIKEAVVIRRKLLSIEPLVPVFSATAALTLWADGQNDEALALAKALPMTFRGRWTDVSQIYASMGRYPEAADAMLAGAREVGASEEVAVAATLLRRAPAAVPPKELPALPSELSWVYLYVGAPERISLKFNPAGVLNISWASPSLARLRKTAAFKGFVRELGLVEYWRARGWPDVCHPVGNDDFACS